MIFVNVYQGHEKLSPVLVVMSERAIGKIDSLWAFVMQHVHAVKIPQR